MSQGNPVYRGKDFRQFYIFKSAGDAHDSVNLSKYSQERDTILLLTIYLCVLLIVMRTEA